MRKWESWWTELPADQLIVSFSTLNLGISELPRNLRHVLRSLYLRHVLRSFSFIVSNQKSLHFVSRATVVQR
jgi:hypothetical protein